MALPPSSPPIPEPEKVSFLMFRMLTTGLVQTFFLFSSFFIIAFCRHKVKQFTSKSKLFQSANVIILETNQRVTFKIFQKRYIPMNLPFFSTTSKSPDLIQAWASSLPSLSLATPRQISDSIFLLSSIRLAASELTRHLFFHGDTRLAR